MIEGARFVVADLTHERPNVYFELGYARGLGKTVVTIAREGTAVHFDVKDWTYIPYIDSRLLELDLKKRFEFELSTKEQ
jgi:nucleoside 2-deoxyribosyltransferase